MDLWNARHARDGRTLLGEDVFPDAAPPVQEVRNLSIPSPPGYPSPTVGVRDTPMPRLTEVLLDRWRLVALVTLAFMVAGIAAGAVMPATYTAQSRVIAGQGDAASGEMEASGAAGQSMATTYSRVFSGDQVQLAMTQILGQPPTGVSATPVPQSSVILIEATAASPGAAKATADAGAEALITVVQSTMSTDQAAAIWLKRYRDSSQDLAEAQAALEAALDSARTATEERAKQEANRRVAAARSDIATAQVQTETFATQYGNVIGKSSVQRGLQLLADASNATSSRSSSMQLLGAAGLLVGACLAAALAYLSAIGGLRGRTRAGLPLQQAG